MSLWDAIRGILRGILQYALYLIPVIEPMQESRYPSNWWLRYWSYGDWVNNLGFDRRPNQPFIEKYLHAHFGYLVDNAVKIAKVYIDIKRAELRNLMGWLPFQYGSFSQWLGTLGGIVGLYLPSWCNNALHGLSRLFYWLPWQIRDGVENWGGFLNRAADRAIDWVRSWAGTAIARVGELWNWLISKGNHLGNWWVSARGLLDQFRSNPTGFILARLGAAWPWLVHFRNNARGMIFSWLGDTWQALVTFRNGPLEYYFNLWGAYRQRLGDFLADPMEYLYQQAEQFLADKMG